MRNYTRQAALQAAICALNSTETKKGPSAQAIVVLNEFARTRGYSPHYDLVVMLACIANLTTTQVRSLNIGSNTAANTLAIGAILVSHFIFLQLTFEHQRRSTAL